MAQHIAAAAARQDIAVTDGCKLAIVTRWKPATERTEEEKSFIAIDRKMFPEMYREQTTADKDAYRNDRAYRTGVPRAVLEAIADLPASLTQSLAFMTEHEHVRLHHIIAKFLYGAGEDAERLADQDSGARGAAAAAVARGFVARTKPPHLRSEEEKEWVALDVVFRPFLYLSRGPTSESDDLRQAKDVHAQHEPYAAGTSPAEDASDDEEGATWPQQRGGRRRSSQGYSDSVGMVSSAGGLTERGAVFTSSTSAAAAAAADALAAVAGSGVVGGGGAGSRGIAAGAKGLVNSLEDHVKHRRQVQAAAKAKLAEENAAQMFADARAAQALHYETEQQARAQKATEADAQRRTALRRPPAGSPCPFSQTQLRQMLATPPSRLATPAERRAQLLLRAYGSDGGDAIYKLASLAPTPVLYGLAEVSEARELVLEGLKLRGELDVTPELLLSDADGDRSNVAAVAVAAASTTVLIRSTQVATLLSVESTDIAEGARAEHSFEVAGSLSDLVGHGPRAWGTRTARGGGYWRRDADPRMWATQGWTAGPDETEAARSRVQMSWNRSTGRSDAFSAVSRSSRPPSGERRSGTPADGHLAEWALGTAPSAGASAATAGNRVPRDGRATSRGSARPPSSGSVAGSMLAAKDVRSALDAIPSSDPLMPTFTGGQRANVPMAAVNAAFEGGYADMPAPPSSAAPQTPYARPRAYTGVGGEVSLGFAASGGRPAAHRGSRFGPREKQIAQAGEPSGLVQTGVASAQGSRPVTGLTSSSAGAVAAPPVSRAGTAHSAVQQTEGVYFAALAPGEAAADTEARILNGFRDATEAAPSGLGRVRWAGVDDEEERRRRVQTRKQVRRERRALQGTTWLRHGMPSFHVHDDQMSALSMVGSELYGPGSSGRGGQTDRAGFGADPSSTDDDWRDSEDSEIELDDENGDADGQGEGGGEGQPGGGAVGSNGSPGANGLLGKESKRPREGVGKSKRKPADPYEEETGCPGARPVVVDLTVTITFKGDFEKETTRYMPARIQVGLYRDAFVEPPDTPADATGQAYPGGVETVELARLLRDGSTSGNASGRVGSVQRPYVDTHGSQPAQAGRTGLLQVGSGWHGVAMDPAAGVPGSEGVRMTGRTVSSANTEPWVSPSARRPSESARATAVSGRPPHVGSHAAQAANAVPLLNPGTLNERTSAMVEAEERVRWAELAVLRGPSPEELGLRFDGPLSVPAVALDAVALDRLRRADELGVGPTGDPMMPVGEAILQGLRRDFERGAMGDRPIALAGGDDAEATAAKEQEQLRKAELAATIREANLAVSGAAGADRKFAANRASRALARKKSMRVGTLLEDAKTSEAGLTLEAADAIVARQHEDDDDLLDMDDLDLLDAADVDDLDAAPNAAGSARHRAASSFQPFSGGGMDMFRFSDDDEILEEGPKADPRSVLAELPSATSDSLAYNGPPVDVSAADGAPEQRDGTRVVRVQNPVLVSAQRPPIMRPTPAVSGVPQDQLVAMARVPVGFVDRAEASPNGPRSLGRIIIRHEPMHTPVLPGRYRVVVYGMASGSYSVSVVARLAYPARDVVEGCIRTADHKLHRIPKCRSEAADIEFAYRLGARKRHLVRDMVVRTEKAMNENAIATTKLREALNKGFIVRKDLGDDADELSESESETESEANTGSDADEDDDDDSNTNDTGSSGSGSEASSSESEDKGSHADGEETAHRRRIREQTERIAQERKMNRKLDLTDRVRGVLVKRLGRLEEEFAALVRSHSSRNDEKMQIEEGLLALREAKAERESEIRSLLAFTREYRRYVPKAARSLQPLRPQGKSAKRTRRASLLAKFGLGHLIDTEGKLRAAAKLGAAGGDVHVALGPVPVPPQGQQAIVSSLPLHHIAGADAGGRRAQRSKVSSAASSGAGEGGRGSSDVMFGLVAAPDSAQPTEDDLQYVSIGPVISKWLGERVRGGTLIHVPTDQLTPAERVRRKPVGEMSKAEAEWAAMDRVLHPELYAHLADPTAGGNQAEDDADSEGELEHLLEVTPGRADATRTAADLVRGLPGGPSLTEDPYSERRQAADDAQAKSREAVSGVIHSAHERAATPGMPSRSRPSTREDARRAAEGLGEFAPPLSVVVRGLPGNDASSVEAAGGFAAGARAGGGEDESKEGRTRGTAHSRGAHDAVDVAGSRAAAGTRAAAEEAGWDMSVAGLSRERFQQARPDDDAAVKAGLEPISGSGVEPSHAAIAEARRLGVLDLATDAKATLGPAAGSMPVQVPRLAVSQAGPRGAGTDRTTARKMRAQEYREFQEAPWGKTQLPVCAWSRAELHRIATVPVQQLPAKERFVRQILARFHDRALPKFMQTSKAGLDAAEASQAGLKTPHTPNMVVTASRMALKLENARMDGNITATNDGVAHIVAVAAEPRAEDAGGMSEDQAAQLTMNNRLRNKGLGAGVMGAGAGTRAGQELRQMAQRSTKGAHGATPGAPVAPAAAGFGVVDDSGAVILAANVSRARETEGRPPAGVAAATRESSPPPRMGMSKDTRTQALIRARKATEADPAELRVKQGELEFHESGSLFSMAFTAVPIPKQAPAKLRDLLGKRAKHMQERWNEMLHKTLKGKAAMGLTVGGIGGALGDRRMPSRLADPSAISHSMTADVDKRSRDLLAELDRAYACSNPTMDTPVLHGIEQRFDTETLRVEIERELDRVLLAMVFEREHVEEALLSEVADAKEGEARRMAMEAETKLSEARDEVMRQMEAEEDVRDKAIQAEMQELADVAKAEGDGTQQADLVSAAAQLRGERAAMAARVADTGAGRRRLPYDGQEEDEAMAALKRDLGNDVQDGDYNPDDNDPINELGALAMWGAPDKPVTPRRARALKARALAARQLADADKAEEREAAKSGALQGRMGLLRKRRLERAAHKAQQAARGGGGGPASSGKGGRTKGGAARAAAGSIAAMNARGGLAASGVALAKPWQPHENPEELRSRLVEVQVELKRVRLLPEDQIMCVTKIPLSVLRGGVNRLTVDDAIEELAMEAQELKNRLRLIDIDRELHFAHASTSPFITTTSLHGVPQQAARGEAIAALEADSARIISRQVAQGIVDDIIEWMLEGWVFGERRSNFQVAGAVTGVGSADQPLRPFESLSEAARLFALRGPAARAAAADAARGLFPVVGDALSNVKAAATLRELDPDGSKYPEAHVYAAGVIPAEAAARAKLEILDKMATGELTEAEAAAAGLAEMNPGSGGAADAQHDATRRHVAGMLAVLPGHGAGGWGRATAPESQAAGDSLSAARVLSRETPMGHRSDPGSPTDSLGVAPVAGSVSGAVFGASQARAQAAADAAVGAMVMYDPAQAQVAINAARERTEAIIEAARGSGDPAAAALAVGAGLGELTGLAGGDGRLSPMQRWRAIQTAVTMRDALRRAVEQRQEVEHAMDETERTLKMAMFLMTLHYFRAVVQLREQRTIWSGSGDADLASGPKIKKRTVQRERMDAAKEARQKRAQALRQAEEAAAKGWAKIHKRRQHAAKQEREARMREERKRKAREAAAKHMQKTVRGFLERLRVFRWAEAERLRRETIARERKGAMDIQRVFRGFLGRQVATAERRRVAAFVRWMRKQEEKLAEREFYKNNTVKRWQKGVRNWWRGRQRKVKAHDKRGQRMTDVAETGRETDKDRELEALGLDGDDKDANSDDSGLDEVDAEGLGADGKFFGAPDPDNPAMLKAAKANPAFQPSSRYAQLMEAWQKRKADRETKRSAAAADAAASAASAASATGSAPAAAAGNDDGYDDGAGVG